LSKGGLLYHFPSKDQLIQGLIQQLVEDFYERLNAELSAAAEAVGTPGRWLRAYIRATFNPAPREQAMSAALSIAIAAQPDMLDSLKACFLDMQQQAEKDGLDPALATLIRLATDGFWYADILQLAPLDESLRSLLMHRLLQLTEGKSL
jgi:AcrR family transcriptional regulator